MIGRDERFLVMNDSNNPYASTSVPLQREEPEVNEVDLDLLLASRTQRLVTFLIDWLMRSLILALAGFTWGVLLPDRVDDLENMSRSADWLLGAFSLLLFYCLFEGFWQRSPAKWLLGLKVVNLQGRKPGWGQIFRRSLVRLVPFEPFSFFGSRPYGWHDKWSNTRVISMKKLRLYEAGGVAELEAAAREWRGTRSAHDTELPENWAELNEAQRAIWEMERQKRDRQQAAAQSSNRVS